MRANDPHTHNELRRGLPYAAAVIAILALMLPAPAAAVAPEGITYFITVTGLGDSPLETQPGCMKFKRKNVCVDGGDCGSWEAIEEDPPLRNQREITFAFDLTTDESLPIVLTGKGRVESRGPGSSIAAVGIVEAPSMDLRINIALSGRSTSQSRCMALLGQ